MIFLDNASTTKVLPEVQEIVNKFNTELFYNPSALYGDAFFVSKEINKARENIIKRLGGRSTDNLIFTSCATESNNMVLKAFVKKNRKALISIGEHPSVYKVAFDLKSNGYDVEFLNLNHDGVVTVQELKRCMTPDVDFISIMHVNNETGAINDIEQLVKVAKGINKKVVFHCDGVQAFGKISVNVQKLGVDFYTISGHKLHAPKGVGALFVKDSKYIKPLLLGGGQENDYRSGTENVSGIMALDQASQIMCDNIDNNFNNMQVLNNYVRVNVVDCKVISNSKSLPYTIMLAFPGCRAETILHMMEEKGFLIGNGSACSSKKRENRNLTAMGYDQKVIDGAIRISFAHYTTLEEIKSFVEQLNLVVKEYIEKVR